MIVMCDTSQTFSYFLLLSPSVLLIIHVLKENG